MHDAERIAIWIILGLIVFWILFRQTSDFVVGNGSLLDLDEFKSFPTDFKMAMKNAILPVADALGNKMKTQWNSMTPDQKATEIQRLDTFKNNIINNINSAPSFAEALNPKTHANLTEVQTSAPKDGNVSAGTINDKMSSAPIFAPAQTSALKDGNLYVTAGTINNKIILGNPPVSFTWKSRASGIGFVSKNSIGKILVNTDLITNFTLISGDPNKFIFVSLSTNQTMPKPPPV